MIDELYEAQQYLEGNNINKINLYRMCYLMICLHKIKGYERLEIRNLIFDWSKKNKICIKYDVNSIINRVFDSNERILKSPVVKINKQDIVLIKKVFDNNKVRLVALAMLCYAKAYADKNGEFYISSVGLGSWLGVNRKLLRSKYIKELIDFEYLVEVKKRENNKKWNEAYDRQSTKYKLNVSLHNSGEFILENNDIHKLFSIVFSSPI